MMVMEKEPLWRGQATLPGFPGLQDTPQRRWEKVEALEEAFQTQRRQPGGGAEHSHQRPPTPPLPAAPNPPPRVQGPAGRPLPPKGVWGLLLSSPGAWPGVGGARGTPGGREEHAQTCDCLAAGCTPDLRRPCLRTPRRVHRKTGREGGRGGREQTEP